MKVPYNWLKELVPHAPDAATVADLLPQIGLGVEALHTSPAAPKGVIVVEVLEVTALEDSVEQSVCTVTDGTRNYTVVSGAPNVRVGLLTAFAPPGTFLAETGLTIGERDILGISSEGMLCSPKELGIYDYAAGLMVLGDDAQAGQSLADLWAEDIVLELEITPNRADAFSILGVARDLAAKLGVSFHHPAHGLPLGDSKITDTLSVSIEDSTACPRFTLRRIDNVTVKPSPLWLQRRLTAVGLRPRNNIVDVTNYVTFELGQPSHAYDLDKLTDNSILVRRAKAGEPIITLNEEALELDEHDLVIATPGKNGSKAIGLAGVIGGLHDSISADTHTVALELAHFDPVTVRKTARRHSISTDAHYRFERGVDPNLPPLASARAASLIAKLSGGQLHPGITDVGGDQALRQLNYRPSRVSFLMDVTIPGQNQERYLKDLGFEVLQQDQDNWQLTVPSWRFDIAIEEDIIEEVSRLHGYEHIGESVPNMHFIPTLHDATHRHLRTLLVGLGLQEAITYVFSSAAELAKAAAPDAQVTLQNPQGIERSVLRTALYPGLLSAAVTNRQAPNLALFEIGRVFQQEEKEHLAILLRGSQARGIWQADAKPDFYSFKGLLEKLAKTLGVSLELQPATFPHLHPGVAAQIIWAGDAIGMMGLLHPEVAARYELEDVYVAELELPLNSGMQTFRDYLRQPHAERDLAVIVPQTLNYSDLRQLVTQSAGERLELLWPFDVYEGAPIPSGQRSLALRLWFRHPERALTDDEIGGFMANIITSVKNAGYAIRER